MKLKTILFLIFLSSNCFSQDTFKTSNKLFRLNILNPGITLEKAISARNTVCTDINFSLTGTRTNNGLNILATPFIRSQIRHYYNLAKRDSKNKNTLRNSGNYFALNSSYYLETINNKFSANTNDGLSLGFIWGFQRTYKNNLNINFNSGLNYNFSQRVGKSYIPVINFTFGYIIFNK